MLVLDTPGELGEFDEPGEPGECGGGAPRTLFTPGTACDVVGLAYRLHRHPRAMLTMMRKPLPLVVRVLDALGELSELDELGGGAPGALCPSKRTTRDVVGLAYHLYRRYTSNAKHDP